MKRPEVDPETVGGVALLLISAVALGVFSAWLMSQSVLAGVLFLVVGFALAALVVEYGNRTWEDDDDER